MCELWYETVRSMKTNVMQIWSYMTRYSQSIKFFERVNMIEARCERTQYQHPWTRKWSVRIKKIWTSRKRRRKQNTMNSHSHALCSCPGTTDRRGITYKSTSKQKLQHFNKITRKEQIKERTIRMTIPIYKNNTIVRRRRQRIERFCEDLCSARSCVGNVRQRCSKSENNQIWQKKKVRKC